MRRKEEVLAIIRVLCDCVALDEGERKWLREAIALWQDAKPGPAGVQKRAGFRNVVLVALRPPPARIRALANEGLPPLNKEQLEALAAAVRELGVLDKEVEK